MAGIDYTCVECGTRLRIKPSEARTVSMAMEMKRHIRRAQKEWEFQIDPANRSIIRWCGDCKGRRNDGFWYGDSSTPLAD